MEQDNSYKLLKSIDTPEDLRKLKAEQLPEVCEQKFIQRGKQEVEALRGTGHVTGRTWIATLAFMIHTSK